MKRRGAVLLFAVAAGATGSHHAHRHVLVVDKDAHHRRTCYGKYHRVFRTIQRAVTAADSGDTIKVCPGTYTETVEVRTPDLTILGANAGRDATGRWRGPESIVQGTPDANGPGVVQLRANDITWDGFTIRGVPKKSNSPGMYTSPTSSGYLIRDTIFFDNGNGIHISDTSGQGNANPGTSPPANVIVRKNKVRNTRSSGIEVTATGAGYQVLDNRSLANTLHGLHFTKDTSGGAVTGNTALDNEDLDCKDESTPLANTWTDNIGGSALPRIICTAPTTLDNNRASHDGKTHDKKKVQEAPQAPQEDEEAQAAPPGPVRLHPPLAVLTLQSQELRQRLGGRALARPPRTVTVGQHALAVRSSWIRCTVPPSTVNA